MGPDSLNPLYDCDSEAERREEVTEVTVEGRCDAAVVLETPEGMFNDVSGPVEACHERIESCNLTHLPGITNRKSDAANKGVLKFPRASRINDVLNIGLQRKPVVHLNVIADFQIGFGPPWNAGIRQ